MVPGPWFIARQAYQMVSVNPERTGARFLIDVDLLTRLSRPSARLRICENNLPFPSS
jgi:hypothetical protein